jgi:hypothetical protein
MRYHQIIHMMQLSSKYTETLYVLLMTCNKRAWLANQKQKRSFFASGNGGFVYVVTVTAVSHSRSVQSPAAVTLRCGLPVLSKPQPEVGPATVRIAKRLERSSAVSSRLSDIAHSQAEQAERKNYLLTVGECLFTVYITYIDVSVNLLNPTSHVMHQQFNIQQLYALHTLYLCVLYLSENNHRVVSLTA